MRGSEGGGGGKSEVLVWGCGSRQKIGGVTTLIPGQDWCDFLGARKKNETGGKRI